MMLVTGAAGFLGAKIASLAREADWRVRAFDRVPLTQVDGIEMILGDIGDAALLRKACGGVNAVVHAAGLAHVFGRAALNSSQFSAVNEEGTGNVVDAALKSGVPHIVLVSSVSVYGSYPGAKCDEKVFCNPHGPYAISKWRGERLATKLVAMERGSLTILRFATIFGEGDRGNVAKLISVLNCGHFVTLGSGQNKKSLIYKEDAARACLCAADRPAQGIELFNVSSRPVAMNEIVAAICKALGRPIPRYRLPTFLLNTAATIARRIGDPGQFGRQLEKFLHDDVYDGSRFDAAFGFSPAIPLAEGLRRQVEFLRAQR